MNYRKLKNKEWKAIQKHFENKPKQLKTEKKIVLWLLTSIGKLFFEQPSIGKLCVEQFGYVYDVFH